MTYIICLITVFYVNYFHLCSWNSHFLPHFSSKNKLISHNLSDFAPVRWWWRWVAHDSNRKGQKNKRQKKKNKYINILKPAGRFWSSTLTGCSVFGLQRRYSFFWRSQEKKKKKKVETKGQQASNFLVCVCGFCKIPAALSHVIMQLSVYLDLFDEEKFRLTLKCLISSRCFSLFATLPLLTASHGRTF